MKILTKKTIRECDQDELDKKEENHRRIMEKTRTEPGEYSLDKKLYKKVLKDIKTKNKGIFKLLNNTAEKFKKAICH